MKQKQNSFGFVSIIATTLIAALAFVLVKKLTQTPDEIGELKEIPYKKAKAVVKKVAKKVVKKKVSAKKKLKTPKKSVLTTSAASIRQQKLFDYIKKNKSLVMSEALDSFKGINERTLRRDLVVMVKGGLIKKHGSTKSTKYVLK